MVRPLAVPLCLFAAKYGLLMDTYQKKRTEKQVVDVNDETGIITGWLN